MFSVRDIAQQAKEDEQQQQASRGRSSCRAAKNLVTLLDLCVSSLRRGHANLLCIVPILSDDLRGESDVSRWTSPPSIAGPAGAGGPHTHSRTVAGRGAGGRPMLLQAWLLSACCRRPHLPPCPPRLQWLR